MYVRHYMCVCVCVFLNTIWKRDDHNYDALLIHINERCYILFRGLELNHSVVVILSFFSLHL